MADPGILASLLAFVTALILCGVLVIVGPLDRPRERGSHRRPTATAGGLGLIGGAGAGLFALSVWAPGLATGLKAVSAPLAFAAALGVLGALDDLFDFGARIKFGIQIGLSLVFAFAISRVQSVAVGSHQVLVLGAIIGGLGTALWLVVVCNAVNFMDGANGLAAGSMAIALLGFGFAALLSHAPALGWAAVIAAGAGLGFLPWNLPTARVFQGDAGALFSSYFFAALAVVGAAEVQGSPPLYFAPMALTPFLADVLLTLLSRARRGQPLFHAHAEHLYQRWLARTGASHLSLAVRAYGLMAIYSGAAILLLKSPPWVQLCGLALGAGIAVLAWTALSRRPTFALTLAASPRVPASKG